MEICEEMGFEGQFGFKRVRERERERGGGG